MVRQLALHVSGEQDQVQSDEQTRLRGQATLFGSELRFQSWVEELKLNL